MANGFAPYEGPTALAQDEQISVICPVQVEWCNLIQTWEQRVQAVRQ